MSRSLTIQEAMVAARVVAQLRAMPGWSEKDAVESARRLARANRLDKDGRVKPRLPKKKCPVSRGR